MQLAVAADDDGQSPTFGRDNCLKERLQMPAKNKQSVKPSIAQPFTDFGSVATGKMVGPWMLGNIRQERMRVAGDEIDVPIERLAKAGCSLLFWCHKMRKKYMRVDSVS